MSHRRLSAILTIVSRSLGSAGSLLCLSFESFCILVQWPLQRIDTNSIPNPPQPPPLLPHLIDEITEIVFGVPQAIEPCDAIFIFGGSHPGLWIHGADAYHRGLGRHVIATGGYKPTAVRHHSWQHGTIAEALIIRDELLARDVPADAIYMETRSTNTLEHVLYAQDDYDFTRITTILAVSRSHGVGRQCRTLAHNIPASIRVVAYPFATNVGSHGEPITRDNWMNTEQSRAGIFSHLLKIIRYGRLGHLQPVEHLSDDLQAAILAWLDTVE